MQHEQQTATTGLLSSAQTPPSAHGDCSDHPNPPDSPGLAIRLGDGGHASDGGLRIRVGDGLGHDGYHDGSLGTDRTDRDPTPGIEEEAPDSTRGTKSRGRARAWCFTCHLPTDKPRVAPSLATGQCRYLCFQLETAPSTGRRHYQGYVLA